MRSMMIMALAIAIGACTDPSAAARSTPRLTEIAAAPSASQPPATSPTPTPYPTIEPLPSDLDPAIRHAVEMRLAARLRSDLAYVLEVAVDPRARISIWDFPTYPEEDEQVAREQAERERIILAVQGYGHSHLGEFGGVYIDRQDMPGVVVGLFTTDPVVHEAAVRKSVGDTDLFATRQVKYTHTDLEGIQERISQDMDAPWVLAIPAVMESVGTHVSDNVVYVRMSSAVPRAAAIIAAHYDYGDRIRVESDGTGVRLIPWSTVSGTVSLPGGRPYKAPQSTPVMLTSDGPGDSIGTCNGSDVGYGVRLDGRFEYPCQIGRRTIYIEVPAEGDGEWRSIGQGTVVVEEGKTARLHIELMERP